MIHTERVQVLNDAAPRSGDYVLYWMQHAQRATYNHALEYAIREANARQAPVVAVFGLTPNFPEATRRAYAFMLEGLRETQQALRERGIRLLVLRRPPVEAVEMLAADAALVVTDRGYLRIEREWRDEAARALATQLVQVESDVVVPIETASDKEEYAAYTLRRKLHRHLEAFLIPLEATPVARASLDLDVEDQIQGAEADLSDIGDLLAHIGADASAERVTTFRGGPSRARQRLADFIAHKLAHYAEDRNAPSEDYLSHLSPYLHFGQISPLHIALQIRAAEDVAAENREAYLEELIVRRELSMNFCHFDPDYDSLACLPDWASETLAEHADDPRTYVYDLAAFEGARTHDPYWNAAQLQMVRTGKMHGYMRMYWGKKILEWTPNPAEAFRIALTLNNRYELDGRDPNGYAGVAWCFGKHDRAWKERAVYGKVRYMSAGGLERKFDIEAYVAQVDQM
jgi:deoxyribodipyrimidine photo-lyase